MLKVVQRINDLARRYPEIPQQELDREVSNSMFWGLSSSEALDQIEEMLVREYGARD